MLANIHSILASESCCHEFLDVGLPRSLLLVQCRQINNDAGPTLLQHWVCCILSGSTQANMDHFPNTFSMLAQRIRRWPAIETALGACSVGYCRIATQQSQDVKAMLIYLKTILIKSIVSAGYVGDACIPSRRKTTTQIIRYIGPVLI